MNSVRIVSLAGDVPASLLEDRELSLALDMDLARVASVSRGMKRASAADGEGPADLAAGVAAKALESAGIGANDIDMLVFATTTPDITFPGSACLLQAKLGIRGQACLDVRSQCTGFLTALDVASRFLATGAYGRILLAAADVPTHINRYDGIAPELAILTGDGAAVAIVEAGTGRGELLSIIAQIDGRRHRELWCEFPASRHLGRRGAARGERVTRQAFEAGALFPRADFPALRATALDEVPKAVDSALRSAGLARVDALLLAHVDPLTEDALVEKLAGSCGRVLRRRVAYGFGATLPLALANASDAGELAPGETVALATAGSGASWGAAVMRW